MKEQVIQFIKVNFVKLLSLSVGALVMYLIYLTVINKLDTNKQKDAIQPIIDPKYFMNLQSDSNRLECVFEQRRCLFENLGLEKEGVLVRCGSVDFCDEKFKVKK